MNWIEALILGVIQGLTEFLPVSSSGHLEIGKALLGIELQNNLTFDIIVHAATVCSTVIVFRKQLASLLSGVVKFQWNTETQYIAKLLFSAIPVVIIGLSFEDTIESFFSGDLVLVGSMLLVTATLLSFTYYAKQRDKNISFIDAFVIGVAQALAVMPGISRSGATIATALILKNKREEAARFSFLMVLQVFPLVIGFISAFLVGLLACKLMIAIVNRSKLIYFAIYCAVVAIITIALSI